MAANPDQLEAYLKTRMKTQIKTQIKNGFHCLHNRLSKTVNALALLVSIFISVNALAANLPTETHSEATINATQTELWAAFTTREGMESWMVARADVDLKIGGSMRTLYSKDGVLGDENTISSEFISLDSPRMYSTRITKPPKKFPFMNAWKSVWTVVYFEPVTANTTKVTVRMRGYDESEESQKMREFFVRGNQYTLDSLAKKFSKPPDEKTSKP